MFLLSAFVSKGFRLLFIFLEEVAVSIFLLGLDHALNLDSYGGSSALCPQIQPLVVWLCWLSRRETLLRLVLVTSVKFLNIQRLSEGFQAIHSQLHQARVKHNSTTPVCESPPCVKNYRFELAHAAYIILGVTEMCVLGRTIHVTPHSFTAHFPNHLRKWLQEKNKPLMVVVAQSFPMAAIIAFPVQIVQFVGEPDKGSRIHLKMGKPIFSWLTVGILFSTGCTPLAQMTNFHLHCEKIWGGKDLYSARLSHHNE